MSQETPPDNSRPNNKLGLLGENWRRTQTGDMIVYEAPIGPEYFASIADRHKSYHEKPLWWRILRKFGVVPTKFD
jgi:hypothetical protein